MRLGCLLPFAIICAAYGQKSVDVQIGGHNVHLIQKPDVVAVRVVKPSAPIVGTSAFEQAFAVIKAQTDAAGFLAVGRSPALTGAMPSGTVKYETTNQVQRVPVFATASANTDIALFPEMIVQFNPSVSDNAARQSLRIYGAQKAELTSVPGRYIVSMPQPESVVAASNNMRKNVPGIVYAEPNFYYIHRSAAEALAPLSRPLPSSGLPSTITDPDFGDEWSLATSPIDFGITHVWSAFNTMGEGVKIAIIDDGVDLQHPDLKDAILSFWDTTAPTPAGTAHQPPYTLQPEANHGTACAGIAAARINGIGVVGVAPKAALIAIKASTYISVNDAPQWVNNTAALSDAIDRANTLGADIISASWGMPSDVTSEDIKAAIRRYLDSTPRRVLVFAAGNRLQSSPTDTFQMDFPASLSESVEGVISVGVSSPCDELKSFTSCDNQTDWATKYLPAPTILAPGTNMATTVPGNGYGLFSGTSAATPFVAGVVALMISKDPSLTRTQIVSALRSSSRVLTVQGTPFERVDAYCLLAGTAPCP